MTPEDLELIEKLVSDRKAFNDFVYTPVEEAVKELKRRWEDDSVKINVDVPVPLQKTPRAIFYVSLVTPNQELIRFMSICRLLELPVLFFEHLSDKFTSNNEWKKFLGKMSFFGGWGKKGGAKMERLNVIDFNSFNGKNINEIKTLWGEDLINFHHGLLKNKYSDIGESIYDASGWLIKHGPGPQNYYDAFLELLIKHGIEFENFYLDKKELSFTKEVFLPALIRVRKKFGLKPLIVALEPTEIEGDEFWYSHPYDHKEIVLEKMKKIGV